MSLDLLAQDLTISEKVAARFVGPLHMRFIFQPLAAIILGIRDGRMDARAGIPPYIFEVITDKKNRRRNLKKGLQAILIPLAIGIVLDIVAQYYLFHHIRLWGATLVGAVVIGLPYSLARGITNRLSVDLRRKNAMNDDHA